MMGPQVSKAQLEKIESYVQIGLDEGAELLTGGHRPEMDGELEGGYYFEPTVLKGDNDMRVFQEEIFGPVVSVTTFKDEAEALAIANDTLYGLGAGVWTRDGCRAFRMGRGDRGRPGVDQLLPPVPGARGLRRLQDLRRRPREPPDDARPLLADEVPAGQLRPQAAGLLLGMPMPTVRRGSATPAVVEAIERLAARTARSSSTSPAAAVTAARRCACRRELPAGPNDVLLGVVGSTPVYVDRDQDERWQSPALRIGLSTGPAMGFSLESTEGVHLLAVSIEDR